MRKIKGNQIFTISHTGLSDNAEMETDGVREDKLQTHAHINPEILKFVKKSARAFFAEMTGTAVLVFLGCMGLCKGVSRREENLGDYLCFGLAVFIGAQICMHNSGGHINPAVTILALFFRKLNVYSASIYIIAQLTGAIIGFGLLKAITPSKLINARGYEEFGLCTTSPHPELTTLQALFTEFLLSVILLLVVCASWDPRNVNYDCLYLKLGFLVYTLLYAGVPYTGSAMNPARAFGPAVWNGFWEYHWIYWVGPLMASCFCGLVYPFFFCANLRDSQVPLFRV